MQRTGLVVASFGLAVGLANDGREDSILLWMLVPVLFLAGVAAAYRQNPPTPPDDY